MKSGEVKIFMPCLSSIVLDITSANEQYKNWYKDEHEISGLTASAGVGVSISTAGGVGAYAQASTSKENIKENSTTHTPSTVIAKDKLTIKSGSDTNIIGSKVSGEKVAAEIEGNLNIESLQEKQDYKEKSSTAGISISGMGLGVPNISGSAGVGKMKSEHTTVTDQAGIYAGKKGFDIKVKGDTDLKGAVIDSKASGDKNKLDTGTITIIDKDKQNISTLNRDTANTLAVKN